MDYALPYSACVGSVASRAHPEVATSAVRVRLDISRAAPEGKRLGSLPPPKAGFAGRPELQMPIKHAPASRHGDGDGAEIHDCAAGFGLHGELSGDGGAAAGAAATAIT
jgi:hypothetical protein